MNQKKLPIGISDFKDVVTGDYCYVDKTLFIKDILDKGDKLLQIPRPRRFGKTLNLSMLKIGRSWNAKQPKSTAQPIATMKRP